MQVTTTNTISFHPETLSAEQKKSEATTPLLRQIIDVTTGTNQQIKKLAGDFIGNTGGSYCRREFTRATTMHFMEKGAWLEDSTELVTANKTIQSKEIGQQIGALKKQEAQYKNMFTAEFGKDHNLEHIVAQSVISDKIQKGPNDTVLRLAQNARSALIDHAPTYLELKNVHADHAGSKWMLPSPEDNTDDVNKFNTIDKNTGTFFNAEGKASKFIDGGYGKTLDELYAHDKAKKEYNANTSGLIKEEKNVSAAYQLNQLGYAHSSVFRAQRDIDATVETKKDRQNKVSDTSYYHMVKETNYVPYAPRDIVKQVQNGEYEINRIEITPHDKIEMVLARLTATKGDYPTLAELKETVQKIGLEIPEEMYRLAQPITEEDHHKKYYA